MLHTSRNALHDVNTDEHILCVPNAHSHFIGFNVFFAISTIFSGKIAIVDTGITCGECTLDTTGSCKSESAKEWLLVAVQIENFMTFVTGRCW
jgi:hypothetical protein